MNINATLLGQAISFILFVWFCMKLVWPPLIAAIEERQNKIADGLAASDRATKDLELVKVKSADQLKDAKVQAAAIIEQANKRKAIILDEARNEADLERQKIIEQGRAEIDAERKRAREELRKQVAVLAIAGAERILERSVDEAANSDIVDKLVAEL
ncbi:MAG: F0F1 ATP synthase subunit B [Plesiomonas sp.]|uniref:F0F1 ATP synthase subunit B n=1 Tax=Plesiomonas sp. TaxID=2486279 RepID=UPI003F38A36A